MNNANLTAQRIYEPFSAGLISLRGSYLHMKSFQVDAGVAVIAAEVKRRRTEAWWLRASAGPSRAVAKARCEQKLLGNL